MRSIKGHPFPIVARFDRLVALSFAFPKEKLRALVPGGLAIDGYEGWGFVTLAMVWTRGLRPAGLPRVFGMDFFLAGYRVFTRLVDEDGRSLRGLKIIRSETDSRFMKISGNLMTGYNYRYCRVEESGAGGVTRVISLGDGGVGNFDVSYCDGTGDVELPDGSPFPDWRTARRFAGPMPFTFSPEGDGRFTVVEGSRGAWKPRAVKVLDWDVGIFREEAFRDARPVLANAFVVRDVDYRWEKGRIVKPGGKG